MDLYWIVIFILLGCIFCIFMVKGVIFFISDVFVYKYLSPRFDGSFKATRIQKSLGNLSPDRGLLTPQINFPRVTVNSQVPYWYQIEFGENRHLDQGCCRIHYEGKWYASAPCGSETSLEFLDLTSTFIETPFGQFTQATTHWRIPATSVEFCTHITYNPQFSFVLFEFSSKNGFQGIKTTDYHQPGVIFPYFRNNSPNQRIFTFRDDCFAPPTVEFEYVSAPVLMFDDAKNTVLISALDNFLTHGVVKSSSSDGNPIPLIGFGPNGEVDVIPAEHRYRVIVVFNQGINRTFEYWGDLLRQFYHATKCDRYADIINSSLGYWTDNGAYYYYHPPRGEKMDETLVAVKQYADQKNIPFQYYQLDSWFYKKSVHKIKRFLFGYLGRVEGGGLYGGVLRWEPDPQYWRDSLDNLHQALGKKPFVAHNRWFSNKSPYLQQYSFIVEKNRTFSTDPAFWDYIMNFCSQHHIEVYEQDWISTHFAGFSVLRSEIGLGELWLRNMIEAAQKYGLTIQFCMATPAVFIYALQFANVTNLRCSHDFNERWANRYDVPHFTQTSMFSAAMGKWPYKDCFMTTYYHRFTKERSPILMALVSSLSGGPVGLGDKIGGMNSEIVQAICRKDGTLYKPHRPLTAVDLMYVPHSTYYICSTESIHENLTWYYVLTMNIWHERVNQRNYFLQDLDITGDFYEYDWFSRDIRRITTDTSISLQLEEDQFQYRVYAPRNPNGCTLLGNPHKYVMMNDKEFSNIQYSSTGLSMDIKNIAGEITTALLIMEQVPSKIIINDHEIPPNDPSSAISWTYSTPLLTLTVKFETPTEIHIEIC